MSIRVVIAGERPLVRLGLKAVLDQEGQIEVCDLVPALELESCLLTLAVDVLVLDVDGLCFPLLAWVSGLRQAFPAVAWVVCGDGVSWAVSLLQAGVSGVVTTVEAPQLLALAIGVCQAGQRFLSPPAATALLDRRGVALSAEQMSVLALMAEGRYDAEIGDLLGFSERTIKYQVRSILGKLGARNRTHGVTIAMRWGLL